MLTNLYIDGFNLYYGALRTTGLLWTDLRKLGEALFPEDTIARICYFTTMVEGSSARRRQCAYLRALETLDGFEAYYGEFRRNTRMRFLAKPVPGLPDKVEVVETVEKQTDVNLAVRLVGDGARGNYEQAAVISNDSDFVGAMRYVRDELGLRVVQVNPDLGNPSLVSLVEAATYVRQLYRSHLRKSQFPDTLTDAGGVITKPAGW